jgi:hypothetical protein
VAKPVPSLITTARQVLLESFDLEVDIVPMVLQMVNFRLNLPQIIPVGIK